jgi:hypothetical protein
MSTTLKHLQSFIRAKNTDDERGEIRDYVTETASVLADAFGVHVSAFKAAIAGIRDDGKLATRLLAEVDRTRRVERDRKKGRRHEAAQASADVLGAASFWVGDAAVVDVVSLVASALTNPRDLLVFDAEAFEAPVAISMAPLVRLAKLDRADFSAMVDARGLHVRWSTGGLNLVPVVDPDAERIVVRLPARKVSMGAVPFIGTAANTNSTRTSAVVS